MNRFYTFLLLFVSSVLYPQKGYEMKLENYFNYFPYSEKGFKTYRELYQSAFLLESEMIKIEENHHINMGFNVIKNWQTKRFLDRIDVIAYYKYEKNDWSFRMGLFQKENYLDKYPRLLFSEEVIRQKPILNGFLLEKKYESGYVNLWLDWTGFDHKVSKESFFVGASGGYDKGIFYLRHYNYLFHWLELLDPENANGAVSVKDNLKSLTSVGLQYEDKNQSLKAKMALGYVFSFERDRGTNLSEAPMGFLWEVEGAYQWFSVKNTMYLGKDQAVFYERYGDFLYWGDTYKNEYNRTDFAFNFIKDNRYEVYFEHSIHHIYQKWVHQNKVCLSVYLSKFKN